MTSPPETAEIVHASCVAYKGKALLVRGPSGAGKSALALQMLALGAGLIADDRTAIWPDNGGLWGGCPPTIKGLIEARGIGVLNAPVAQPAPIVAIVDLSPENRPKRLQNTRDVELLGIPLPLYCVTSAAHLPAALMLLLSHGRHG